MNNLLDDYYTEDEWAAQRRKSVRTVQRERQERTGAPYVLNGKTVLYPKTEGAAWLHSRIVRPVRRRG